MLVAGGKLQSRFWRINSGQDVIRAFSVFEAKTQNLHLMNTSADNKIKPCLQIRKPNTHTPLKCYCSQGEPKTVFSPSSAAFQKNLLTLRELICHICLRGTSLAAACAPHDGPAV